MTDKKKEITIAVAHGEYDPRRRHHQLLETGFVRVTEPEKKIEDTALTSDEDMGSEEVR